MSAGTLGKEAAKEGWKEAAKRLGFWGIAVPAAATATGYGIHKLFQWLDPDPGPPIPTTRFTESDTEALKSAVEDAEKKRQARQNAELKAIGPIQTDVYNVPSFFFEEPKEEPKRKPAGGAMIRIPGRRDIPVDETLLAALLTGGPEGMIP